MFSRLSGSLLVLTLCAGFAGADDVDAILKAVENDGKLVRFTAVMLGGDGKVIAISKVKTASSVASDAKILSGKWNDQTKKLEAGAAIPGGLKADIFKDLANAKAVQVRLTLEAFGKNRKVTQIIVRTP